MRRWMIAGLLAALCVAGTAWLALSPRSASPRSAQPPLRVLLIPADGGTESGTLADYRPIFDAVARSTALRFDLKVAQSYGGVIEAMCNNAADIAFVGSVTYLQAQKRDCAELLAVAVKSGRSVYYSGLFVRADSPVRSIADLRGRRVAFGDVNSTSAFIFPVAMFLDAGIDPVRDLSAVRMTGTHANSLAALINGEVDAAALSFDSYDKAVRANVPGARDLRVIARSEPIPYPPLIANMRLAPALRARLRDAFETIDRTPGITPEMIRGYGGARVDGYVGHVPAGHFEPATRKMAQVTPALKDEMLRKSAERQAR
ncbi:phosphonate ABC transporter substrate-binding protein [Sphingopyxis sp. H038]|uniref:phosphate/phosphite/phosphonate ABC transporter substrate-binding protein n=1 Tax=unclassified Sphingopyxis TaxID=2614943 RepID=UPI00073036CC|nr:MULTISPECIES: phosphate/phosphite/phosphonate ABC transporter substrate-binding protein [unclassified Sphingopyxis]KTE02587.1 phosphonate ABC transporter substrate-binding protein [Sphingopyxis sp. H012]KTE11148.1 phosphonate ABC transporter substrate-binding protein [Sphingopyxis sp. H053]KTE12254.1 phosphonate ABC transporter substrate-binding protein [Sphingopyxis sp. H093]KTE30630.1 phosphonate ABC transporter substrate-binding protein [Sphingopyxis sp. H080]KTE35636.1 phosphonate ABC t